MIDAISNLMLSAQLVAFVDDGCSDSFCRCERCPDDDLLRDVEVEDVELDCQRCLLCNSLL